MTGETGWTTPADLRRQVRRLWDRGLILASLATGEKLFPRRLVLKRPGSTELRDRFDEIRTWVAALRSMPHVRLSMRKVRHRVSGTNLLPHEAWVDTFEDAIALIRKQPELDEFRRLVDRTRTRQPALLAWVAKRPLRALQLAGDWRRLLDIVGWLEGPSAPRCLPPPDRRSGGAQQVRGGPPRGARRAARPSPAADFDRCGCAGRRGRLLPALRLSGEARAYTLPGAGPRPSPRFRPARKTPAARTSPSTRRASRRCVPACPACSSPRTRSTFSPSPA